MMPDLVWHMVCFFVNIMTNLAWHILWLLPQLWQILLGTWCKILNKMYDKSYLVCGVRFWQDLAHLAWQIVGDFQYNYNKSCLATCVRFCYSYDKSCLACGVRFRQICQFLFCTACASFAQIITNLAWHIVWYVCQHIINLAWHGVWDFSTHCVTALAWHIVVFLSDLC